MTHRASHILLRTTTALGLAGLVAGGATAAPDVSRLTYAVSIAGLPIAEADLTLAETGRRYDLSVDWRTSGLASVFAAAHGSVRAAGRLGDRGPGAESYRLTSESGKGRLEVALALAGGRVRSATIEPVTPPSSDLVPLRPEHRRDVIDPLSAVLTPVRGGSDGVCGRTLPIFDGWSRYDVRLTAKTTRASAPSGFVGDTVICAARWVPVAGHRPHHNATRYMAENTDIEVGFARLAGHDLWLPVEVAVGTMIGTARATVETAAVTTPVAGPKRRSRIRS